jgi:hypothetical protein
MQPQSRSSCRRLQMQQPHHRQDQSPRVQKLCSSHFCSSPVLLWPLQCTLLQGYCDGFSHAIALTMRVRLCGSLMVVAWSLSRKPFFS